METLLVVLITLNLLLLVGLLVLAVRRPKESNAQLGPEMIAQIDAVVRTELQQLSGQIRQEQQEQRAELSQMLRVTSDAQSAELAREREARAMANKDLHEVLGTSIGDLRESVQKRLEIVRESNEVKLEKMRETIGLELTKLRDGNEAKLEKMRETVDEKLQGTLEKRLGESFSLVSERLEQVQKGLGEMQTLASDVGGLKRVLTNVKSRGGWGEVQLARQLEDVLTPDQYAENVATLPGSSERVEFAVKLPGAGDTDTPVWLPIDSKFPQEDYERLLTAQEAGDVAAVDSAGREIERALLVQAKTIASKYVDPPHTTDFGIMYLPTEGLFAEVMRRPGFVSKLHNEHRIAVAGPTTLMSLLNSLQMGFRTLAIEKRSSEVWKVLSAAKTEFQKYGDVWDRVGKQLKTVQNTVEDAGRRTRAVERRLRDVETLEVAAPDSPSVGEMLPELDDLNPEASTD
jgi:DNA recombination protein RmuC